MSKMDPTDVGQVIADLNFKVNRLMSAVTELERHVTDLQRSINIASEPRDMRYMPARVPGVGIIRDSPRVGIPANHYTQW